MVWSTLNPFTFTLTRVTETQHFFNPGYGWLCKHCTVADEDRKHQQPTRGRFFSEGEAEDKDPTFSTPALARWTDVSRQSLVCPRCGIEEMINKA